MPLATAPKLKVGIVGAGPGGLATAIQLRRLDNIDVEIFDQAHELREIGAVSDIRGHSGGLKLTRKGISINDNTWRLLQELDAAEALEQFTNRGKDGVVDTQHR